MSPRILPVPGDCRPALPRTDREGGFVLLLAIVAPVIPLLLILGASATAMMARQSRLLAEVLDERAIIAAEAGIDLAIYQASTAAGLTSGSTITRTLGNGMSFVVRPTYLYTDGVDNDLDGRVDALDPDENVFEVLVEGTVGSVTRRVVAYLGPEPTVITLPGAVTLLDPFSGQELHVQGASDITGINTHMNGTVVGSGDTNGAMIASPYTLAQLLANIPASDRSKILGVGSSPSLGVTTSTFDMAAIRQSIQNSANIVLTSSSYNNRQFGNGQLGQFNVVYRQGNVDFKGNTRGAGIMFITGNLHIEGTFRFDGIIFLQGDAEIHGTTRIYGGMVVATTSPHFYLEGTAHVIYSTDAISGASAVLPGRFLAFNGWQEIARR